MTLAAITAAKISAQLTLEANYHALVRHLANDDAATTMLSKLAEAALNKAVLDQLELDVIANGTTAEPTLPQQLSAEGRLLTDPWMPCPCGNTINQDGELICAECRASIGI